MATDPAEEVTVKPGKVNPRAAARPAGRPRLHPQFDLRLKLTRLKGGGGGATESQELKAKAMKGAVWKVGSLQAGSFPPPLPHVGADPCAVGSAR